MNVVLWILAGLLAVAFLTTGLLKLIRSRAELAQAGLGWVEDFGDGTVKLIGALEVLAAIGLILPAVTGIAEILVPVAASGLVLVMVGALVVHVRRKEHQLVVVNLFLMALAAVVAWGRFGPYAF
jgi:hypothetical protein